MVTALESMFYSFRGNMAYTLIPLSLYTAILSEGVIKVAFERAFSQINGMVMPTSPKDTVLFIAERLLTCGYAIKPPGMMNQMSAAPMLMGLSMLESLLGTLPVDEGDAALAALGTRLTVADLRAVWLYARAIYQLESDAGKAAQQCTKAAVRAVFETLEKGPLCWYLMSNYAQLFDRAQKAQGLGMSVNDVRVRVLRRYLAAAAEAGDPYREGWCAADLALWLLNEGVPYTDVEALAERSEKARKRARHKGLPAFTIKSGFRLLEGVQQTLDRFKQDNPESYRDLGVKLVMLKDGRLTEVEVAATPRSDYKTCAACGTESRSMALCTGCRSAYFCNRSCQKAAWKDHKEECKRISSGTGGGGGV